MDKTAENSAPNTPQPPKPEIIRDAKGRIVKPIPQQTNKNGTAGAPTKYDPKFCQMLIDHFTVEPNYVKEMPHYKGEEIKWTDYKVMTNPLPTFLSFAQKIGVNTLTLERWAHARYRDNYRVEELRGKLKRPEFCSAYARAKELQKFFIIENGLNGLYNPQFAIFVAKNITDMKDKVETDITSGGKPLPIMGHEVIAK